MVDTFCYFDKGELWVRGVNIAEYAWGTCNNHVPRRDRKLLLTARELDKLQRASQDKGLTIVGLRLFLNERGLAKVVVGAGPRPQVVRQARIPQGERRPARDGQGDEKLPVMIKAIFLDVDGTLISFKTHRVPASALDALREAHARGVQLFIATGRAGGRSGRSGGDSLRRRGGAQRRRLPDA